MRESLRHEHQNHEQQNLVRVAENLELTDELNRLRKKNGVLKAEVTRLEAKTKVNNRISQHRGTDQRDINTDGIYLPG